MNSRVGRSGASSSLDRSHASRFEPPSASAGGGQKARPPAAGAGTGAVHLRRRDRTGLPLWQPKGAVLIEELERLAKETELKAGYKQVRTPHICKEVVYERTGHLPYYAESMYPPMEMEGVKYYLKPMNCPHHHKIMGPHRAPIATCPCGSPSTAPVTATRSPGNSSD